MLWTASIKLGSVKALPVCIALLAGCASSPVPYYQAPPAGAANASIVGARVPMGASAQDRTVCVAMIDGQAIRYGDAGIDQPIGVAPGERTVRIEVTQGRWSGGTEVRARLEPARNYIVRAGFEELSGFHGTALFWIEDQGTGQAVSDRVRADVRPPEVDMSRAFGAR